MNRLLTQSYFESAESKTAQVLNYMQKLYTDSAQEISNEMRIAADMSNHIIGETTQQARAALIEKETLRLHVQAQADNWDADMLNRATLTMIQTITTNMFREHWFESTLSTLNNPIHAATFGTSMFRYDLRMLMADNPTIDRLREFGWIMLDVNGLRSFKDCTSHLQTTKYLQAIVRILLDPQSGTNQYLQQAGIRTIPMATGGDEFVLYLRGTQALSPAIIDHIVSSVQHDVSSSDVLRSYLNFDDESVLITYGLPTRKQRNDFDGLTNKEKRQKLAEIRASLPDEFIPSIAGGGATLDEGVVAEIDRDEHDLLGPETFMSIREKIIQATIDLAEDRQKKNKERDVRMLETTNPKLYEFRLRNDENRRLQKELEEVRKMLTAVLSGQMQGSGNGG